MAEPWANAANQRFVLMRLATHPASEFPAVSGLDRYRDSSLLHLRIVFRVTPEPKQPACDNGKKLSDGS
jgi:hypothetical protein